MAKWGTFLVSVIVSSRRMARGKEKPSVGSLAPGSIICLLLSAFSYLSLKSRGPKQSATDVLVQAAWYMNSVSMQIVILGRFLGTAEKTEGLLCKIDRGHD